jgi:hypothetical protein
VSLHLRGRAPTSIAPAETTCVRSRTPSRRNRGNAALYSGSDVDFCLDLVSRPDAFAHLWPKLRSGYLLDALERLDAKPAPTKDLVAFVRVVDGSLPEDLRARAEVLLVEGNLDRAEAICDEVGESADDLRVMIALKRGDTAEALRLAKEIDRAS